MGRNFLNRYDKIDFHLKNSEYFLDVALAYEKQGRRMGVRFYLEQALISEQYAEWAMKDEE